MSKLRIIKRTFENDDFVYVVQQNEYEFIKIGLGSGTDVEIWEDVTSEFHCLETAEVELAKLKRKIVRSEEVVV